MQQPSRVPGSPPPSAPDRRQQHHLPHRPLGLAARGHRAERPIGAHLIRHSLATHLVNRRRPINEIADLLGHRSIDTTAIYVKVAVSQLAEVALPFPGDA
ncbi:tyrosine-type recombinase/integrase [Microvirga sp. VF16]|uniref:tyrosine-type recombinase/integrase n=1 Tax=Microvirga sp. VF16 TaxID=2807101 RepID=UPI001FF03C0D|nr:tyrosine-type recombinase/integrase [Microvirga sp. VF16]